MKSSIKYLSFIIKGKIRSLVLSSKHGLYVQLSALKMRALSTALLPQFIHYAVTNLNMQAILITMRALSSVKQLNFLNI